MSNVVTTRLKLAVPRFAKGREILCKVYQNIGFGTVCLFHQTMVQVAALSKSQGKYTKALLTAKSVIKQTIDDISL